MDPISEAVTTAKGRYSQLESLREPYLRRARDCAKVTIPYLVPPLGHTPVSQLYTPYQSLGSRGVNNLAAKLLLTLFPTNSPFFRYAVTEAALRELEKEQGAEVLRGAVDKAMSKYEQAIQDEIETTGIRPSIFPALKHLIVGGNVTLFMQPKGGVRMFELESYVCKRDPAGNVIELITKETVSPTVLSQEIRDLCPHHDNSRANDDLELYTWIKLTDSNWESHQEIDEHIIESTRGTYPKDKSPYIVLRWAVIDGEDYGRGYVEEYLGDLFSLEGLSQAIVEASAAAARVIIMVKPGSPTTMRALTKAPSGAVISGNKDDVGVLQLEKYADFRVSNEVITEISKRLAYAFLLNTAVQRSGERVTATEVQFMAQELESALGGTYSVLSQELQLPFLMRLEYQMHRDNKLPKLPKGFAKPMIVTGVEALGRGNDLTKLKQVMEAIQMLGPQVAPLLMARFNVGEVLSRITAAAGIDADGLIKPEEQVQAEQAQQQKMQMMQQVGPQAVSALGGLAKQNAANNGAMQQQQAATPSDAGSPPS